MREMPTLDGRLAENILHFTHALRKAGVRLGSAQVQTAISAVAAAGFTAREDFYHTLRATLITRASDLDVFHQVFGLFWRDPEFLDSLLHMMSPQVRDDTPPPKPEAAARRAEEALAKPPEPKPAPPREEIQQDAKLSWSDNAVIRAKDFEQMTAAELAEAAQAVAQLALPIKPLPSRRARPAPRGTIDRSATIRRALRQGGEVLDLPRRAPVPRPPDLVALCDVSGSMSVYSRMMMRYLHALTHARHRDWGRVHAFTFGTDLTNVTRALAKRDPDLALASVGQDVSDWEGGTRIGPALAQFNKTWSRRVLSRGAVVLLITDGLERGDLALLAAAVQRLHRAARRLLWLNPLLRYDGFAPLAGGARTLLPEVDAFHACHSIETLSDLSQALSGHSR